MRGTKETMKPIYYSAAWTDSGFFVDCSHAHETIERIAIKQAWKDEP
jgi:hypothetical protein